MVNKIIGLGQYTVTHAGSMDPNDQRLVCFQWQKTPTHQQPDLTDHAWTSSTLLKSEHRRD